MPKLLPSIRLRTIHDPARTLSIDEQGSLVTDIVALNSLLSNNECFLHNWARRSSTFMADTDLIVLAYEGEELVGHFSCRYMDITDAPAIYVDTFTVHPRMHNRGVGARMGLRLMAHVAWRTRRLDCIICSRISAPCLATATRGAVGASNYYPSYDPSRAPQPRLTAIAIALSEKLWPDKQFSVETGVLEAAYGGRFLPERTTRDAAVQAHFERHFSAERGDAVVQVCRLERETWAHFVRHMVGRSVRKLGAQLAGTTRWPACSRLHHPR